MFQRASELLRQAQSTPKYIIFGLLPEGGKLMVAGQPKVGKSILVLEMAMELSEGKPFLGVFPVSGPRKVALIQAEIAPSFFNLRLSQAAKVFANGHMDNFYLLQTCEYKLDNDNDVVIIRDALDKVRPDVLMVDPLYMLHLSSENTSDSMGKILTVLNSLSKTIGCSIVLVHHFRKHRITMGGKMIPQGMEDARGTSAFRAWADTSIAMFAPKELGGSRWALEFELRHFPDIETLYLDFDYPKFNPVDEKPDVLKLLSAIGSQPKQIYQIAKDSGMHHSRVRKLLARLDPFVVDTGNGYKLQ